VPQTLKIRTKGTGRHRCQWCSRQYTLKEILASTDACIEMDLWFCSWKCACRYRKVCHKARDAAKKGFGNMVRKTREW
jgi:hypothetical protein